MAMTIQELREKRKKAWDTARDFLDSKRNANGVLSEEDSKTYDAMEQTIVDLGKEIQRLERQAEIEAEMNKATSTPILGKPATPNVTEKTGTASDTYKTAFWNSIRNRNWIDVPISFRILMFISSIVHCCAPIYVSVSSMCSLSFR